MAHPVSAIPGPRFDDSAFQRPGSAHRGAPFWAWNTKLDQAQLLEQIDQLHAMGFGGFHIHVRVGLETEYLGDEFMRLVRVCVDRARELGMYAWLYDEDRWPSGYGGGLVTEDAAFRSRYLLLTEKPYGPDDLGKTEQAGTSRADGARNGNGELLGRYGVSIVDGVMTRYRRLGEGDVGDEGERVVHAYLETALPQKWFNNQTYVDTLNPRAVERFIDVTHEKYKAVVGDQFGRTVPAIFTDEPQFPHKTPLRFAEDSQDVVLPWTGDFAQSFADAYGFDLLDRLPELIWELPAGAPSKARYGYHDHVCERFASAFADTLGRWCKGNSIALTGHMMEEPTLTSQTVALGEAMRSFRSFDLPGIDMLCDRMELTTAKQAQSAARQFGRNGVMSELYGVTNWDFDFAGHKRQGDWQAALGVTLRVHHLSWVSMAGEAKRDYPASIGYQSPWWREYGVVEDHFGRLNVALKTGRPHVRVGVIHPIESFWLCFGPQEQTANERAQREAQFENLTQWLLHGLMDFDFIAESLLPQLTPKVEAVPLQVGAMGYDVIVVPGMRTIRGTTLSRLLDYLDLGGRVIVLGDAPSLVDADVSEAVAALGERAERVAFGRAELLGALADEREIDLRLSDGMPAGTMLHQIRADGSDRLVFICNTDRERGFAGLRLDLRGRWDVTALDTMTGESERLDVGDAGDWTRLRLDMAAHGHALLRLVPRTVAAGALAPVVAIGAAASVDLSGPVPVTLSEPNVLLLDQAEYRLDDGPWRPREELLRADNVLRAELGWPLRMDARAQPWTQKQDEPARHRLSLRFTFDSDVALTGAKLALEGAATITLDGAVIAAEVDGWFVDKAIDTVPLPDLGAGRHVLQLDMDYRDQSNVEWCYILGDFGVRVEGHRGRIVAPVRQLGFGDWTGQGLPFYVGNVTYHCGTVNVGAGQKLKVDKFSAPLLSVDVDGVRAGVVAYAPFELALPGGRHAVDVTAFGSRMNGFGALHNWDDEEPWHGPGAWRVSGDKWAYEYRLTAAGILAAPRVVG